ncbi:hypothetical protein AAE478_005383 [Parahypoxylon ruwenzoriense]
MAPIPQSRASFEILSDTSSGEDDHSSHESPQLNDSYLHDLPISFLQNHQSSASSTPTIDSLTTEFKELHIETETQEPNQINRGPNWNTKLKNQGRRRLTRPAIAANTFEVLETVAEDESQHASESPATSVSNEAQHYLKLPGTNPPSLFQRSWVSSSYTNPNPPIAEKYLDHPLCRAARNIPTAGEQLAKHRDGQFEWLLTVRVPIQPTPRRDSPTSKPAAAPEVKEVHFGCNLLPTQQEAEGETRKGDKTPLYTLLVSPLADGEEALDDDVVPAHKESMALAEPNHNHSTPVKGLEVPPADSAQQPSRASTPGDNERHAEVIASRLSAQPVARIEDSVEALDKLEEQLEAFDEAAHFRRILSPTGHDPARKSPMQSLSVRSNDVGRSTTPQPKRSTPIKPSSASIRIKPDSEPRHRPVRKSASMIFLDPPKLKIEDKSLTRAPPKKSTIRGIASLLPPKQPAKPARKPTIPTFELPGDEIARKLKEKREARVSAQATIEQATKPTISSLRRSKSARAPVRPNFELPGEAISRRKREEREVQLKAQEEEERKRREFKARPVRSSAAPNTLPRETIASKARQSKIYLAENSTQQASSSSSKRMPAVTYSNPRSPLSSTNNQSQPRGRGLHPDPVGTQPSRGTSSSTGGSISGKRSSVSMEDVQQQRLRGQEIYKRDNSWTEERERERREREALAKLAREEAAERSRQQSREWAAKKARKRMTVASLRDVMVQKILN